MGHQDFVQKLRASMAETEAVRQSFRPDAAGPEPDEDPEPPEASFFVMSELEKAFGAFSGASKRPGKHRRP